MPQPQAIAAELACSRFVTWGNAYLRGATSLDEAAAAVTPTWVSGLPDDVVGGRTPTDGPPWGAAPTVGSRTALTVSLGLLRRSGVTRLRLALPAPGDPLGLAGPLGLTRAATEAGAAVLTLDGARLALLIAPEGDCWTVHTAAARVADVPDLGEAERALAQAVRTATALLASLDVARPHPRAAPTMATAAHQAVLAPGYPARAHRLLAQSATLRAAVTVARDTDGGALTVQAANARFEALGLLERAARRAMVAAHEAV